MNELISLVLVYQEKREDLVFEKIIKYFEKFLNVIIRDVNSFYREDLKQEILIKIYKVVIRFKISQNADFKITEAEFVKYIKKVIYSTKCDFLKSKSLRFHNDLMRLNELTEKGIEYLETVRENSNFFIYDELGTINNNDKEFLNLFIERGTILTQKEVAKKLGITQQAVQKKLKQITKYYFLQKTKGVKK